MKTKNFYWLLYKNVIYLIYLVDIKDGWLIGPWLEVRTIGATDTSTKLLEKVLVDSKTEIFLKYRAHVKAIDFPYNTRIIQESSKYKLFKINSAIII